MSVAKVETYIIWVHALVMLSCHHMNRCASIVAVISRDFILLEHSPFPQGCLQDGMAATKLDSEYQVAIFLHLVIFVDFHICRKLSLTGLIHEA